MIHSKFLVMLMTLEKWTTSRTQDRSHFAWIWYCCV